MPKKLPETLYVKATKEETGEFFRADPDPSFLIEMGETAMIGTYRLVEVREAKGTATLGPARKTRR